MGDSSAILPLPAPYTCYLHMMSSMRLASSEEEQLDTSSSINYTFPGKTRSTVYTLPVLHRTSFDDIIMAGQTNFFCNNALSPCPLNRLSYMKIYPRAAMRGSQTLVETREIDPKIPCDLKPRPSCILELSGLRPLFCDSRVTLKCPFGLFRLEEMFELE